MKKETLFTLIVDDCPLICESYKQIIAQHLDKEFITKITIANNCSEAAKVVNLSIEKAQKIHFAIIDLKLPPCKNNKFISGEDIGLYIRKLLPKTKIIIATSCYNNFRIHNVFKTLNPEGFLMKKDLRSGELKNAYTSILKDIPYYSPSVLKLLRQQFSTNFILDPIDRKILYELSLGSRTKDLPEFIPLSSASIEKRKRHLRKLFNVTDRGDRELIIKAKERGFI